jgi:hypothetical protein
MASNTISTMECGMDIDMNMIDIDMISGVTSNGKRVQISARMPANLTELLQEVKQIYSQCPTEDMANILIAVLRKHKIWPALQVKKFFKNKNLVLLHNTYKRTDVSHFQSLYDECRSVVLDMGAQDNHIVVSYTDMIPEHTTLSAYKQTFSKSIMMPDGTQINPIEPISMNDVCYEAYEGTVVTVYFYQDKWHFGTSTCPLVDSSRYFHPNKSHGQMVDEALAAILGVTPPMPTAFNFGVTSSEDIRKAFTHYLNPARAYAFILVHHENKHVADYTQRFGANYAKLVHIVTRDRASNLTIDEQLDNDIFVNKIVNPYKFASSVEAVKFVEMSVHKGNKDMYGFIVTKSDGKRLKVSSDEISTREEFDLGNPNMWINMLHVYIQNKPHYKITNYQATYCPDLMVPLNNKGQPLAPTYIIHTVICSIRDVVYQSYKNTTSFNSNTKRFYIQKAQDAALAPIMRFHMAQLRNIQITTHNHAALSPHAIYHYICHHQTMKNLRLLIKYFATSWIIENTNGFPPRTTECFFHLDALLSQPASATM